MATHSLRVAVDTPSLRERTTDTLREAILGLHFKPGEKLVERRLCEDTGVSRTCVREALRHLEAEGLVVREANRGMFVASVGPDEARQIYEIREALEPAMARHFVRRATPAQRAALDAAARRIADTIFGSGIDSYVAALDSFTDALIDGADNAVARQMLRLLGARMTYLRTITARAAPQPQKERTLESVRQIAAALGDRDADMAEAACRAYVRRSAAFALEVLRAREAAEG